MSAIFFNENVGDAEETRRMVEANDGRRCIVIQGDVRDSAQCRDAVARAVAELGRASTSSSTTPPSRWRRRSSRT